MFNGGYQIIDASNIEISMTQTTVINNREIANILRTTTKPIVVFENLTVDAATGYTVCSCFSRYDNVSHGRAYVINADSTIVVTTDGDTVKFAIV